MRLGSLSLLFIAAISFASAALGPKTHQNYRTEAAAAYARKDFPAARDATAAALKLRPDSPRYLYNFAALSAKMNEPAIALDYLRQLAALGVYLPAERDPDFAPLQGKPEFLAIVRTLAANREPQGHAELLAELPGRTGIFEGIAFRERTGDYFFGDVHHRCIWRRDHNGQLTRFSPEDDELLGVFGLAIDERRNTLWAAMTGLPEMAGFTKEMAGTAALAEFNLTTSELRRVIPVPGDGRDHGLGDLTIAADGTVYATDSKSPVIWKLAPGAAEIEKFVESAAFSSLQGIVFVRQTLIVADYSNGLFAIELPTADVARTAEAIVRPLAAPKATTLLGLDGLVAVPDGLIATQNGIDPQRVFHIALSPDTVVPTAATVLTASQPNFKDLTLLTLANGRATLIAQSGWDGFDPAKAPHPAAHTVRIFQVALP